MINLLPDLRQAKLREHRRRQLVTGISVTLWVVCGGVIGLLAVYTGGQKVIIGNVTKSIADNQDTLRSTTGLVDALTADQHVAALPALYDRRVFLSKFFTAYGEASPVDVKISSLAVDSLNTLTVAGTAPSYAETAKLARALAVSNVKVGTGAAASNTPYFSSVNITSVEASEKVGVNFTITAVLDSGVTHHVTK